MTTPTPAQQKGLAVAPIPFAVLSFLSSGYVIYFLLCGQRQRLRRMYHRLVLAMNVALLFLSLTWIWLPFAVPEGTPDFFGASGNTQTCTASAFLKLVFSLSVPTYYASLSLQALMGIRNNFKEEKYKWIEKWVHIVAYCIPCGMAAVFAATENFNPYGSGCFVSKAPMGCEADPGVPCERGQDIGNLETIVGLALVFLYFVFPPAVIASWYCWIRRIGEKIDSSWGMQKLRELARKEIMQSAGKQISLYLLLFWLTWILMLVNIVYTAVSGGKMLYGLQIAGNCIYASQGVAFAFVYFTLERLGKPEVHCLPSPESRPGARRQLTIKDIRLSAARKSSNADSDLGVSRRRPSLVFNIFDGTPDEDSPWAKYLNGDFGDDSDEEETPVDDDLNDE